MTERLRLHRLSLGNKVGRTLWNFVWLFLYRPTPNLFYSWRRMLLRLFGAKIGKGVRPYPSARIWAPWNLEMGDYSCIGGDVDCYCVAKIFIGPHATVSQYSYLCAASHDYTSATMPLVVAPISIGPHAWVTADVFIGPGVTVGEGSVVTARSSVFSDIEPWTVARGNPARSVKKREFNRT